MFKARASLQRRIQKKVKDYQVVQKRKKVLERKIRAAQKKAFWEELERAAMEKALSEAKQKARQKVQSGLSWRERLVKISEQARKTRTADLLGFQLSGKAKSPAEMILGTKKKKGED